MDAASRTQFRPESMLSNNCYQTELLLYIASLSWEHSSGIDRASCKIQRSGGT